MLSKISILLSAALALSPSLVSGFKIPEGQADGIYTHTTDDNGKDVHTRVGDVKHDHQGATTRSAKFKRDSLPGSTDTECQDGVVTSYDYATVKTNIKQHCGTALTVSGGHNIYITSGGATAYMCLYNSGDNTCSSQEIDDAFARMSKQCGATQTGYALINDWRKSYGLNVVQAKLCDGSS